jgi:hypothetical protein
LTRRRPAGDGQPATVGRGEEHDAGFPGQRSVDRPVFGLFAVFLLGQTIAGRAVYNRQQASQGGAPVDYPSSLTTGHNIEAIFENWESEFLQMGANVILAIVLIQQGSAISRKPRDPGGGSTPDRPPGPDAPWPARRPGRVRTVYANSLPLAFLVLFALSILLDAVGGRLDYNDQMTRQGRSPVSLAGFPGTPTFWFQSFQNYQSEFLSLGSMVVLSIFLRQAGSPQSKAVDAPNSQTGL